MTLNEQDLAMLENEALCAFCNVDGFHTGVEHATKKIDPNTRQVLHPTIEQAHINSDIHAQTCDDENCDECNPSA